MSKPIGKVRSPLMVLILSIITLGIYSIFYHYFTFEELKNYRGQGWSGAAFLIFAFIPPLHVVLIVVPWLLPAYVGRMYAEDNQEKPITGWAGCWALLPILGPIIWLFRLQNCLNRHWQGEAAKPKGVSTTISSSP